MIYEVFNLVIGVSVLTGTIVLLMGDNDNHSIQENNMETLIPLAIVIVVTVYAVKKLKPELWKEAMSRFKK